MSTSASLPETEQLLLGDAQTSGGLLLARRPRTDAAPTTLVAAPAQARAARCAAGASIGHATDGSSRDARATIR